MDDLIKQTNRKSEEEMKDVGSMAECRTGARPGEHQIHGSVQRQQQGYKQRGKNKKH